MAISVVMPALEMAQETGKLVSWLKQEGEPIVKGEPLLEIETDKAVTEIEAPGDGILAGIKAQPGDEVPVGQIIAWLVSPGETPPTEVAPVQSGRRITTETAPAAVTAQTAPQPTPAQVRISPKARRLAKEHGVDLGQVKGSGPGGEILTSDILAGAPAKSSPAKPEVEALNSTAKLMAERTTKSWTTVPHFFVVREVAADALVAAREKYLGEIEKTHHVRLTHTDLLVALVARILAKHPRMNATWAEEGIRLNKDINVAVAMAVENAVVAAVIPKADNLGLREIALQRQQLAERARAGRLKSADISGGTFTISNLGMYHVDAFTAIITPPQAAILAVGQIANRVVPVDGKPDICAMMTMTLSSDHRVIDGARAALFLNDLAQAIQTPEKLLGM